MISTDDEDDRANRRYYTTEDEDSDNDSVCSEESYDSIDEEDIVPMSYKAQRAMEEAVVNIQMCQELFMSWNKELRKPVSSSASAETKAVVDDLRDLVKTLKDESSDALASTRRILKGHLQFAQAFYRSLRNASNSGLLEISSEMEKAMEMIREEAIEVAQTIAYMKENLQAMGEVLERATQRAKRKKSSIGAKVVNWFKKACGVLATVLRLGATLANILCQPHIGAGLGAGSALCKKLESAIGKISEDGKINDEQADKVLHLLQNTLREEVSRASDSLSKLDDCQTILSRHLKTSGNQVFKINAQVTKDMERKWRKRHTHLKEMVREHSN